MTILAAFLLDLALGDPRWMPHPVRLMGWLAGRLEALLRPQVRDRGGAAGSPGKAAAAEQCAQSRAQPGKAAALEQSVQPGAQPSPARRARAELILGTLFTATVVGASCAAAVLLQGAAAALHPWAGWALAVWLIYTTVACRGLGDAAHAVEAALASGDIDKARRLTSMIVGRDTTDLDEDEIVRAVVETVAENLVDAVVSPLFYAAVGGAPAAIAYRAINTLDSMVGYRNQRYLYFGRASARLDDVANYIPARIGGGLVVLVAMLGGMDWRNTLRILRRDGRKHPSPNSGLPEAAFAGALGVRLGGLNHYGGVPHVRPYMGDPAKPLDRGLIRAATALMRAASVTAAAIAAAVEVISNGWQGIP